MTSKIPPRTCTIGPSAVTGERCDKPAVTWFIGSDARVYAECAEHAAPGARVIAR